MRLRSILLLTLICVCGVSIVSYYGQSEEQGAHFEESSALVDSLEMEELAHKQEMLDLALSYKDLYEQMERRRAGNPGAITEDGVAEIIRHIAGFGYPVTAFNHNMENHELFEHFLVQIQEGKDEASHYYQVGNNGGFSRMDYQYEDGRLYITESSLVWDNEGNPVVRYFSNFHVVEEWSYSKKGYLLYKTSANSNSYALLRVKPLAEKERKLCKAYITPVGYQSNNLFLVDWDQDDMSTIVFNDLYEILFFLDAGENTRYGMSTERIPAAEFEPLFKKYLGTTPAFLQKHAMYFEDSQAYFWNYPTCSKHALWGHAPAPEVVDSWENEDGTLTMIVDAVDDYRGNDRAFTHEVTIRIQEDGSFVYLSNRIWPEDKPHVPDYTPRSEPII